jgi:hypothetical protein
VTRREGLAEADRLVVFAGEWREAAFDVRRPLSEAGTSIIVTRPGRVTSTNVQECTAALRQAGASPAGLVVVNPDRFDTSTGQLPPAPNGGPPPAELAQAATPEWSALRGL